jgi:hypothetical protein
MNIWPNQRLGFSAEQITLNWARLSCHRFVANQVRLQLFILAYNLGNFLRRLGLPKAVKDWSLRSIQVKLIRIGGRIVRHARQFVFQIAEVAVSRDLFAAILGRIAPVTPGSRLSRTPGQVGWWGDKGRSIVSYESGEPGIGL